MIGRIRGCIIEKLPPELVVEVNGVGYEILMPLTCFYQLPGSGCEVSLFTHLIVREDAQLLYGFSSKQERALFRELIKVNGVGPKLALTILSGMSASEFIEVTRLGEIQSLIGLPGVGRKTAERLVIEMKDRFKQFDSNNLSAAAMADFSDINQKISIEMEAISALVALGYKPQEARKTISKVFRTGVDSQTLIKDALKVVMGKV